MNNEKFLELDATSMQILKYLESHPNAADTKHGIARWWLQRQILSDFLSETEHALNQLVKLGLIEKVPVMGGEDIYRSLSRTGQDNG